ncbi:hypothetical protein NJB93_18910 [Brucella intermedia]|uniref:hypothetical protein n=1 Tax=Brucella intermedia TaxID=94625 RepID=UPI00209B14A2|nr:hypothetical protein [Brucella intermedia]MCO7728659.1 hypothetical protein [Brucella intermedia]
MSTSNGLGKRNAISASITKLCLSTALLSVLGAESFAQQVKADGTTVTVPTGTIVDTSGQASPNGLAFTLSMAARFPVRMSLSLQTETRHSASLRMELEPMSP